MSATDRAAAALLAARRTRRWLAALPDGSVPADDAAAYAIQDAVAAALGPVGGWKVGAAGPTAIPSRAPIQADALHRDPGRLDAAGLHVIGVEAELAYSFARDLPRRPAPYALSEVIEAVAAIHPAIEILDTRFMALDTADPLSHRADHQNGGALLVGPACAAWRDVVPTAQPVRLWLDEALRHEGVGGNAAGDPLRLLAWLADGGAGERGLRAGDVVTTGSCSGTIMVARGTRVRAEFPGIGGLSVALA